MVVPEQIVAQDLAHAIRAFDPSAEVRLFSFVDEAVVALEQGRPKAMVVHAEPRRFLTSSAGRAMVGQGVPLAFLGTMAEAQPDGRAVLASPFTEATVAQLLRRLFGETA